MELPVKITPDNLRDSIVEIKYTSNAPFEILLGFIYNALDDTYLYTNRPLSTKKPEQILMNDGAFEIPFGLPIGQKLFFTEKIKLELRPNALIFNCVDKYIGWSNYIEEIEKTLKQIFAVKDILKYTRVGIRYISEYETEEIKKCTKFEFSFGIPEIQSETFLFRSEFLWSSRDRVILTLQHKTPVLVAKTENKYEQTTPISIIDIDVISNALEINDITEMLSEINRIHRIEKDIFFTLLKPEYLKTLNPVYQ